MVTEYDKALAAVLAAVVIWLNQKYGFALPSDPPTLALISGAIISGVVYLVPNKPKGA